MECLKNKYIYKGDDVTLSVLVVMERTVRFLAEQLGTDFDTAYERFLATRTCRALQNPKSAMFAENAEFIVDEYFREINEEK